MRLAQPAGEAGLSPEQFEMIARIAHDEAGLVLSETKQSMISSRLIKRLRALNLPSFDAYCSLLRGPLRSNELPEFISAMTTNVTHFFREPHHFETLANHILPNLKRKADAGGRIRIWSAGCSSGQEPYSIAMCLLSHWPDCTAKDIRILGTDIDPNILSVARGGQFQDQVMTGLPAGYRDKFFSSGDRGLWTLNADVRSLVRFNALNLLVDWPMRTSFDVIFCRNVVIYFDGATQSILWPRFEAVLDDEGWLMVGHSERLDEAASARFESVGITTYKKRPAVALRERHSTAEGASAWH